MAAASRWAVIASSNRPHLLQGDAEIIQRHAFAVPVADLPEDRGRLLVGGDRLLKPAHPPAARCRDCPAPWLAVPVTGLPEDGGRILERGDRLLEPAHLAQRDAEMVECSSFITPVA